MEPTTTPNRLLAVLYRFDIWADGERKQVTEEEISGSALGMLLPQLHSIAKRTRVAQGPGIVIFDNYNDARQAAQTLAAVADRVELHHVELARESVAGWPVDDGRLYRTVEESQPQIIKE